MTCLHGHASKQHTPCFRDLLPQQTRLLKHLPELVVVEATAALRVYEHAGDFVAKARREKIHVRV